MTNPSQLKYLDAMGIPVWVSRDLIIEADEHNFVGVSQDASVKASVTQSTIDSDTFQHPAAANKNNSEESAQSIIDSLANSANTQRNIKVSESEVKAKISSTRFTNISQSASPSNNKELSNQTHNNLLFKTAHHHVYSSGSESADWMVIGHSPEPFNGIGHEPFAGDSGELLNNMLRAVGMNDPRGQAYLLNAFDINESSDDALAENTELLTQKIISIIEMVQPKVILLVGQIAPQNLLKNNDPLIIMRSKIHKISALNIPSIVTYYPSYLLQKPIDKRKAWEDLKLAMSQIS